MDKAKLKKAVHVYIGKVVGPRPDGVDYAAVWQTEAGVRILTGRAPLASITRMELKAMTVALRHFPANIRLCFHIKSGSFLDGLDEHKRLRKLGVALSKDRWPYRDYSLWKVLFDEIASRSSGVVWCWSTEGEGFDDDGTRWIDGLAIKVPKVLELSEVDGFSQSQQRALTIGGKAEGS